VDLAQLALSEAIVQQANAETNLNQALQVLRSITGFKEAHWPQFPDTLPNIKVKNIDVEKLVKKLPTLQILNNQYLSAQARISLAEKQRYPDPTIGVQGGRGEGSEGNNWLMGVTVSIPLFVRNTYSAEVDAARADVLEVVRKRRNLVRQIHAEIESSAERYEIFYQATQSWQQASGKPLSDGIVLLERLWQAGEINTTDYLVQLKQRLDSQIAGAELKGRAWQAWVELLKVSGQSDQKLDSTFIRE
jgi:cobalt-zinc-cadmium efflux system outer membrane protein